MQSLGIGVMIMLATSSCAETTVGAVAARYLELDLATTEPDD